MLRPVVRMLMKNGITFPVLSDLLRGLCVEVAAQDLLTDPKARTDSRISVITGVHRKEIRRLRALDAEDDPIPDIVTLNSQIIARWLAEYPADGVAGHEVTPAPLPRTAPAGKPSFDALITSITTDIRPRAVLDDWLGQKLATLDADDQVRLNTAAFIPRPGGEEQLFYFARNLHDHIAAAVANVSAASTPPFMDRAAHYDRLTPEMTARLEASARVIGMRALLEVNRLALDLLDSEPAANPPDEPGGRLNFGVYLFTEDAPPR